MNHPCEYRREDEHADGDDDVHRVEHIVADGNDAYLFLEEVPRSSDEQTDGRGQTTMPRHLAEVGGGPDEPVFKGGVLSS